MPGASSRVTWKGAISFGLVHIPIELRSGTAESRQSFKWIDSSSNSAVGNQQVSKASGEAVDPANIVKGLEVEEGQYVTLTKDEIRAALPKTTQLIEIEAFVDASSIPFQYFQKPYHVAAVGKGQKAYALLRDTLKKTGRAGLAKVVISTKQHLAALLPVDNGLVLNLLRWEEEVRDMTGLVLPDDSVQPSAKEIKMAEMLVNDLAAEWSPGLFHDEFKAQLAELVKAKAKKGQLITVAGAEKSGGEPIGTGADILDLTELLQRSLSGAKNKAPVVRTAKPGNVRELRPAMAAKAAPKAALATGTRKVAGSRKKA